MSSTSKAKKAPNANVRPTIDTYSDWMTQTLDVTLDERTSNLAETNAKAILNEAQNTSFFESLPDALIDCSAAYEERTGGAKLLSSSSLPPDLTLATKPFTSMVEKSFRQNVT